MTVLKRRLVRPRGSLLAIVVVQKLVLPRFKCSIFQIPRLIMAICGSYENRSSAPFTEGPRAKGRFFFYPSIVPLRLPFFCFRLQSKVTDEGATLLKRSCRLSIKLDLVRALLWREITTRLRTKIIKTNLRRTQQKSLQM